ncbi:MAG: leucyl aminopeptidase family protein [Cyanobacteria bacterium J06628_6]
MTALSVELNSVAALPYRDWRLLLTLNSLGDAPLPTPIYLVNADQLRQQHPDSTAWAATTHFDAKPGTHCLIPGSDGALQKVLVGKPDPVDTWTLGKLSRALPVGAYNLADEFEGEIATKLCLGWQLGQYRFSRYKQSKDSPLPTLSCPDNADSTYVQAATEATTLVRDLINTPANDMGPADLEATVRQLANTYSAELTVITGEDLLSQNYPMIHAVGRASNRPPRLIDLRWGDPSHPIVTLVGKGVCFDSGGLNLKPAKGMKMMKKDMGGAAQTIGLAQLIMQMQLPVRLRLMVGAVENSVSSNATRPLDVIPSRKGITVEIGNTDAEGRLVLADALWEAASESPQLLIDCATLTGAARVAVGTELPAVFCNDDATAQALIEAGGRVDDPVWQLPLYEPYRGMLDSSVADLNNISNAPYGGAITAALFLQTFTQPNTPWIHVDLMAYNLRSLPGRPEGGDAMGMRALFELIRTRIA